MEEQSRQIDFIDREDELAEINSAVCQWGNKKIICINGEGGIGKTRLLNEICVRYSAAPPQFSETTTQEHITVALVQEFANTDWSRYLLFGARRMADELGITLTEFDADFDITKMSKQLDDAIALKPQAILLRLGTHDELLPALRRAFDAGIKVIGFDNYLAEDCITTRINQDFLDCGVQLVHQMAHDIGYKGDILAIYDPQDALQMNCHHIMEDSLRPYPDVHIGYEVKPNSQPFSQTIYQETHILLQSHPSIKSIWVAWDEYVEPAIQALQETGKSDCAVYSYGLNPEHAKIMLEPDSPWRATVDASPIEVGRYIINLATLVAMNEPLERSYSFKAEKIDKEKLKTLLDTEGKLPPDWLKIEIPWTPRLHARQNAFSKERRLFPQMSILDFDDDAICDSENILYQIAVTMGEQVFTPYFNLLADDDLQASYRKFADCFNEITQTQRVLLFFDTVDNDNRINILERVFKVFSALNNFVCIVTGREAKKIYAKLYAEQNWQADVQEIPISSFKEKFGKEYLQKKQAKLGFTIDPTLAHNLLLLAEGRPILIDLAVDWLAREIPLEWIREKDTTQLEKDLSGPEKQLKIKEFQRHLVQYIGQGQRQLDWLFLVMAHIFPLDVTLIEKLRAINHSEAEKLFADAQSYTFIKRLPDGRIKLHDVMQEMICDNLWNEIDPDKERRRRDSQLAIDFYKQQIQMIESLLSKIQTDNAEKFIEREKLYQKLFSLRENYLYHLCYITTSQGVEKFKEMFEQATRFARLSSRKMLLDALTPYLAEFSFDEKYDVNTRWVRYWLDQGQYDQARKILGELLQYPSLTWEQLLGLFTNEANYYIHIQQLTTAIESLRKAYALCENHLEELESHRGTVLNTLGWVYRQMGKHTTAADYYDKALIATSEPLKVATVLNNAGYVYSFDGLYDKAIQYCAEALSMRQRLQDIQGQGKSYTTIGDVYRNMGDYPKSLEAYNKAFEIFEPEHIKPWLAYLYSHRGATLRLMRRFDDARQDISASIALKVTKELPWAYHVLGCVDWDEGNLDTALKLFEQSDERAHAIGDMHTRVNNLIGCAEIFYQKWIVSNQQLDTLPIQIDTKSKDLKKILQQGYNFPHHQGRMLRVLADTAFAQKRYPDALPLYAESYFLLEKRFAGYGQSTFQEEFDRVEKNILYLAQQENHPEVALQWCKYLKEYWNSKPATRQSGSLIGKCTLLETKIRLNFVV